MNQQLVTECHRLEQLVQSQPNPMMIQMMRSQGLSVDENASQRTSNYGGIVNQSQRYNNDFNDDTMSRNSNMPPKRLTNIQQQNKDVTQLQKLASAAKLADGKQTKGANKSQPHSPDNQVQNEKQ